MGPALPQGVQGLGATKGWQSPAGDTQAGDGDPGGCSWTLRDTPASGHQQQRGSLGKAVPPSCATQLCQARGPSCLLSRSVHSEQPGGGVVLLLLRDLGAGDRRAALPALGGARAGLGVSWDFLWAVASLLAVMEQRGGWH